GLNHPLSCFLCTPRCHTCSHLAQRRTCPALNHLEVDERANAPFQTSHPRPHPPLLPLVTLGPPSLALRLRLPRSFFLSIPPHTGFAYLHPFFFLAFMVSVARSRVQVGPGAECAWKSASAHPIVPVAALELPCQEQRRQSAPILGCTTWRVWHGVAILRSRRGSPQHGGRARRRE
ncbi:hypothetical protein B0H13DRAFT_2125714, partial [Mycena leptocephala]